MKATADDSADDGESDYTDTSDDEDADERHQAKERRKARRDRYMSLASKMRIDQMLEQVNTDTQIDFDYVAFLCVPHLPPVCCCTRLKCGWQRHVTCA